MADMTTSLLSNVSGLSNALQGGTVKQTKPETSFASVLSDMLEQYNQVDNQGDEATVQLLTGSTGDLSGTLISTEKAEIALNLTVAIRNKAVDAYKEIMNMQI
jgi:flagellar hook-basal body complex protein FliE